MERLMALLTIQEVEKLAPVFKGKVGNAIARGLLKALNITKLSDANDSISSYQGAEFAKACNEQVAKASFSVNGMSREEAIEHFRKIVPEGPFITISNHPIGTLDGTILIDFMGHVREDYKCMVNEILAKFEGLRPSLIQVNPYGEQVSSPTARSIAGVRMAKEHLMNGHVLGLFPSGAVSDKKLGRRPVVQIPSPSWEGAPQSYMEPRVRDREWQTSIVKFIRNAGVPVLPIRFLDGNSRFFYNLGLISWKVRILMLPTELFNKAGKNIRLAVGPMVPVESMKACKSVDELRTLLRASVYSLE